MSQSRYRFRDDAPYFLTFTVNDWTPAFRLPEAAEIVLSELAAWRKRGAKLYAFVLLDDHLHCIVQDRDISARVRAFKGRTARMLLDLLKRRGAKSTLSRLAFARDGARRANSYQFWSEGAHPQRIGGERMMRQKIAYIHQNPVKRGYVDCAEHWRRSSARNYAARAGVLDVDLDWAE